METKETKVTDIEVRKKQLMEEEIKYWMFIGGLVVIIGLVVGAVLWIAGVVRWWGALLILAATVAYSYYTDVIGKRSADRIRAIEDEAGFDRIKQRDRARGRLGRVVLFLISVVLFSFGFYLFSQYTDAILGMIIVFTYYGVCFLIARYLWRQLL
nr:MAG TPA: hypothetical protein [Caudoviricetes sp.]